MKKLRRFLATLVVATLFASAFTAYAAEDGTVGIQLDDNTGINPADFEEANEELMRSGHMARMARASKTLSLTHYYQDGKQSWSNDIMQTCNKTIASAGCCLTSFAMIEQYFGGGDDPGAVNTKMGKSACPFVYATAASKYNLTISNSKHEEVSDSDAIDFIVGAIDAGNPVLVGMKKDGSTSTHFVAAYGYDGSTIYIHDPASGRDYTTLDQYLKNYCVNRLYVYTN